MRNFQNTFQKRKRSYISIFSLFMTVALKAKSRYTAGNYMFKVNNIDTRTRYDIYVQS